jgi:hypothetical protein
MHNLLSLQFLANVQSIQFQQTNNDGNFGKVILSITSSFSQLQIITVYATSWHCSREFLSQCANLEFLRGCWGPQKENIKWQKTLQLAYDFIAVGGGHGGARSCTAL